MKIEQGAEDVKVNERAQKGKCCERERMIIDIVSTEQCVALSGMDQVGQKETLCCKQQEEIGALLSVVKESQQKSSKVFNI